MTRILAAVVVLGLAYGAFEVFRFVSVGPGRGDEKVIFEVPPRVSFRHIAADLEERGLVSSALRLRAYAKLSGQGSRVKHGEYALDKGMTPQEILSVLVSGKSIQYPITIPEGSNVYEIAGILDGKKLFKGEEFLKMVKDKKVIQDLLGIEVSSLEGYLFPETYLVTRYTTLRELLANMVQNFKTVYGHLENEVRGKGQSLPLSRHELVTLASIVEKETGATGERPVIASVFYNRLKKGMKLQSDPTIIYGLWVATGAYQQNIRKDDITKPTPYNTYVVGRLPWGPIGNPGREALAAVMMPAKSEFLYFVSRNDGTHVFTRDYDDHIRAVKSFQMDPTAREGKSWRNLTNKNGEGANGG